MNSIHNQGQLNFNNSKNLNQQKRQRNIQYLNSIGSTLTFKIKDSLYMGTSIQAFKDEEFILLNWVESVIIVQTVEHKFDNRLKELYGQLNEFNKKVEKQSEQQSIRYLHCDSSFLNNQIQQGIKNLQKNPSSERKNSQKASNFDQIFTFIESSQQSGTSCLILATSNFPNIETTGYIFSIFTGYMMKKYHWSLYKSLEYMNAKHPNASISQQSLNFLNKLQIQLMTNGALTFNWQEWKSDEELIIRNTFINGRKSKWNETSINKKSKSTPKINKQKMQFKQTKLQRENQNFIENDLKSSLKQSQQKSILKKKFIKDQEVSLLSKNKNQVFINQQLNSIKQFNFNSQKIPTLSNQGLNQSSQTSIFKQNNVSTNSLKNQKGQSFKTARSQRISLSVRKIVAKYRDQKISDSKNQSMLNSKKISFDNCSQINNMKGLNKKKSFYNFQACIKISEEKQVKLMQKEQISKIVKKIKTQKDLETLQQINSNSLQTLPDEYLQPINQTLQENQQKSNQKIEVKTFMQIDEALKNKSWLQIINKKQNSQKKTFYQQSFSKKCSKQNESNMKNDKNQNQSRIYIKEVKKNINDGLTERKLSINERIFRQQSARKKDKNLIIEFKDFKQMLKKKQKSIGNLTLQNVENQQRKQSSFKKNDKIASVIQKLKMESMLIQSSTVEFKLNKHQEKKQKKSFKSKQIQVKWR